MKYLVNSIFFFFCFSTFGQSALDHLQSGLEKQYYNDFDGAIQEYSQAIALDSTYRDAYFHRGVCLSDVDKYKESINDLSKAISLDTNFIKAYYIRGIVHFNNGELDLAIMDLDSTILKDSLYLHAFVTRGKMLLMAEELVKACEDFLIANEKGDSEAIILLNKYCVASETEGIED